MGYEKRTPLRGGGSGGLRAERASVEAGSEPEPAERFGRVEAAASSARFRAADAPRMHLVDVQLPAARGPRKRQLAISIGLALGDAAALAISMATAAALSVWLDPLLAGTQFGGFSDANLGLQLGLWAALIAGLCLWFSATGHYTARWPLRVEVPAIWNALLLGLLFDAFVRFASKDGFSRLWLVSTWVMAAICVPCVRIVVRAALDAAGLWRKRVVLVGGGRHVNSVSQALVADRHAGYVPVSSVALGPLIAQREDETAQRLASCLVKHDAQMLFFVPSDAEFTLMDRVIDVANTRMLPYAVVPPISKLPLAGLNVHMLASSDAVLLAVKSGLTALLPRILKRAFDIVATLLLLLALSPILLVLCIAVAADGGPILFGHRRIGRGGHPFSCLKFRTMAVNAQSILDDLLARDPAAREEWSTQFKLRNDPRVTRAGRFLRATSLDEIPQLINVLRGEMSLVGPRPVVAAELAKFYGTNSAYYVMVRPGITGLWQISGRSETDYARRVFLDGWYVRNWNLWMDIQIMLGTVPAVLSRRGAY